MREKKIQQVEITLQINDLREKFKRRDILSLSLSLSLSPLRKRAEKKHSSLKKFADLNFYILFTYLYIVNKAFENFAGIAC